jgi:predicted anti-sigma-YlaC factor YlaD
LGWLNDYLDQTADPEMRAQLEKHINACPNCWVIFDTTKRTVQVFKGMEAMDLPPHLHAKIMAALQKKMAETA